MMCAPVRAAFLRTIVVIGMIAWVSACHGSVGPTQGTPPLESLELTGVPASGTVGDRFPLKVVATNLHGATEDVTTKVTWKSSDAATAEVSREGELVLVGPGTAEIHASIEGVSTATPVSVAPRPPESSTLSGVVSDSVTRRGLANATVQVLDGGNAGNSTTTDESGFYSLPALTHGAFTVRATRSGYEPVEASTTLSGDAHLDLAMRPLPPPPFTGASFNVRVSVASNKCGIDLPSSGRLVLSGSERRLTIRVVQGVDTREYSGSLESDGTFSGSTNLVGVTIGGAVSQPHGMSTIKGLILDSNVSGTEKIATHLCPNGLGIVNASFSGSR
jgi:hypothetical protein